jgi:hypothetical protein
MSLGVLWSGVLSPLGLRVWEVLGRDFVFFFSFRPRFTSLDVGGVMNSGVIIIMKLGSWVLRRSHLWVSFILASVVLHFGALRGVWRVISCCVDMF